MKEIARKPLNLAPLAYINVPAPSRLSYAQFPSNLSPLTMKCK